MLIFNLSCQDRDGRHWLHPLDRKDHHNLMATQSATFPGTVELRRPRTRRPQHPLMSLLARMAGWVSSLSRPAALTGTVLERQLPPALLGRAETPAPVVAPRAEPAMVADARLYLNDEQARLLVAGIMVLFKQNRFTNLVGEYPWIGETFGYDGFPVCRVIVQRNLDRAGLVANVYIYGDDPGLAAKMYRLLKEIFADLDPETSHLSPFGLTISPIGALAPAA